VSDAVKSARIAATDRPAERQTCQQIDQVTYYAFADSTPWFSGWDAVVRGVLQRVPAAEALRPFAVRQRVWADNYPRGSYSVGPQELQSGDVARADRAAGTPVKRFLCHSPTAVLATWPVA
jgi:hypothetical protein